MSKYSFLNYFFDLFLKSSNLTSLMLVDTVSFISDNKRCLRLILSSNEYEKLKVLCELNNYKSTAVPIKFEKKGNTWYNFSKYDSKESVQTLLAVISSSEDEAYACLNAEITGDIKTAGELFDYPKCCVEFYQQFLQNSSKNWALNILNASGEGPYPYHANRIATGWRGINFAAELFPCSLKCKDAIQIGLINEKSFYKLGLSKLAEKIKSHSLASCILRKDGSIIKYYDDYIIKNDERLIHFSD